MSASPLHVWICGADGTGKSEAAWSLFEELAAAGQQVEYVDIDQLGMLTVPSTTTPSDIIAKPTGVLVAARRSKTGEPTTPRVVLGGRSRATTATSTPEGLRRGFAAPEAFRSFVLGGQCMCM